MGSIKFYQGLQTNFTTHLELEWVLECYEKGSRKDPGELFEEWFEKALRRDPTRDFEKMFGKDSRPHSTALEELLLERILQHFTLARILERDASALGKDSKKGF